jgi:endonuclease/exonuclease/phosphatase family metal-dependent hydrolase
LSVTIEKKWRKKMNTMPNPQHLRTRRTPKRALPAAATLLLTLALLLLLLGPASRPAEASCPEPPCINLPPLVTVDKPSVVVEEGQTATNTGTFENPEELDGTVDDARISASVGTITQSGSQSGTWSWSMGTTDVPADETKTVTITATDSRGAFSRTSFSLTVKNDDPPPNDPYSSALDLATLVPSTTTGYTNLATMEAGEPRPYSPTKDCGITGVSNSVWFKFTYGKGGEVEKDHPYLPPLPSPNASYNFDTQGSNFDTVLALYEGSSVSTLKQIECSNDNSLPNWNDNLRIPQTKLSVGHTYYVQLTGTGGARSGKYQLHYEPRGLTQPKVMAYNIAEGSYGGGLPAVAETIKALQPDIVLLNEIREYSSFETSPPYDVWNQTKYLANEAGIPYFKYEANTITGINGTKGYAILSRYPISSTNYYEIEACEWYKGLLPNWGILKATIEIDGLTHEVFSTRFAPLHDPSHPAYNECLEPYNREGHELAMNLVRSVPNDRAVIFGGDLNADYWVEWARLFRDNSGLTDVFVERPDPYAKHKGHDLSVEVGRIDYIYYRGPYSVYQTQMRDGHGAWGAFPGASDHPYVFAHLLRHPIPQQPDTTITSGPSGSVSATTASFGFSSSAPGSTFECSLDGTTFSACTSPKEYSGLANGEHTFQVRAIGTGGTDPTPASRTWTVDTTGPEASITGGPTWLDKPRSVSFTFSGAEPGGGYECKLDGPDPSADIVSACSSGDSFPVGTDGIYTFSVRASDALGNFGTPASRTWMVDTVAPAAPSVRLDASSDSGVKNDNKTNDITPTISGTAEFASTVKIYDAQNNVVASVPAAGGPWSYTFDALGPDGSYSYTVKATDPAGNESQGTSITLTIDTAAPDTTIGDKPSSPANSASATFTFSSSPPSTMI